MALHHATTICRICEPLCAGFACQKGIAFTEVVNDPDRVTTPMRRTATGFEPVSWDEAMDDIGARLSRIAGDFGSGAVRAARTSTDSPRATRLTSKSSPGWRG